MTEPTISITMPCYNHEKYISQALDSALSQTHAVSEIVIVNDGSTDGSAAIIEHYARQHPDLIRVVTQPNQGPAKTRTVAVEAARGEYVVPLDADDYLHPEAVETWLKYARENPRFAVVYGSYYRVDGENNILDEVLLHVRRDDPLEGNILATLLRQNAVTATALICRQKILEVGGYYSEDTSHTGRGHEDYFMYLKLLLAGYEFGYVPRPLFYYRDTPNSVSSQSDAFYQNRLAVLKHVYKLDTDKMVEATDVITWKRVAQIEDAFYTLRERDKEIAELKRQVINLRDVQLPPLRDQAEQFRLVKQSRAYRLLWEKLFPFLDRLRGIKAQL